MPIYTFINKNTKKQYDKEMSYEELIEYIKQKHIEQVFKIKITRYSDAGGIKDQFTDWCKSDKVEGKGTFDPYGKATKGFKKKK
jgi:hypothetical protein